MIIKSQDGKMLIFADNLVSIRATRHKHGPMDMEHRHYYIIANETITIGRYLMQTQALKVLGDIQSEYSRSQGLLEAVVYRLPPDEKGEDEEDES